MGLLQLFWSRKAKKSKRTKPKVSGIKTLKSDIEAIKARFFEFNEVLSRHQSQLADQSVLIEKNTKRLDSLENIITNQPTKPLLADLSQISPPIESTKPAHLADQSGKLDVSVFSPQEKKILSVFFENSDLSLSYADIGKFLGKSANTIKNQIHQINIKADLFNYNIDNQSRKRFKLKDNIKLEKYLKVR
jgi:DNA-binding CsgD family transcriptional regulator